MNRAAADQFKPGKYYMYTHTPTHTMHRILCMHAMLITAHAINAAYIYTHIPSYPYMSACLSFVIRLLLVMPQIPEPSQLSHGNTGNYPA